MKPAAFDYLRADSLAQACEWLDRVPEARILAGGQSLLPILNMRLATPPLLIDISQTPELLDLRVQGDWLHVGAAVTQGTVQWRESLAQEVPLLGLALPWISHFQIRNRGTVCGSIVHADPSAELPLCLLALQGQVVLHRLAPANAKAKAKRGAVPSAPVLLERVVAAQDFFTGMLSTARAADEVVSQVRFPLARAGQGFGFTEFSHRHGDFALCAVAAVTDPAQQGLRLAVAGVSDRPLAHEWPWRADVQALATEIQTWIEQLDIRDDDHLSAAARRRILRHLAQQALAQAGVHIQLATPHSTLQPAMEPQP